MQVQTLPPFWDPGRMPIPRDASFLHACREADALLQLVTQVCPKVSMQLWPGVLRSLSVAAPVLSYAQPLLLHHASGCAPDAALSMRCQLCCSSTVI